jgi:hypothetical protein
VVEKHTNGEERLDVIIIADAEFQNDGINTSTVYLKIVVPLLERLSRRSQ